MRKCYLITVLSFFLLNFNCNTNSKLLSIGKLFFNNIDNGKYDIAFNLLCDEDKKYLDISEFSLKIQKLIEFYYYPPICDSNPLYSISTLTKEDQYYKKFNPFPKGNCIIYKISEKRRIPDFLTISAILDEANPEMDPLEMQKMLKQKLLSGNVPTVLDSSRNIILIVISGKPFVYIGAKYWKASDTLENIYENYIKSNIIVSEITKSEIYRNKYNAVSGYLEFKIKNNSRDTINSSGIKISGIFNDIKSKPTSIETDQDKILPKTEITSKTYFFGEFIQDMLDYSNNKIAVKSSIEIISAPNYGNGPDNDSIMALKENAPFSYFCDPVKSGVIKVFVGM